MYLTTVSLLSTVCEPVKEGMSVSVSVIGGLDGHGFFWARLLPDENQLHDLVLQNISKCLL